MLSSSVRRAAPPSYMSYFVPIVLCHLMYQLCYVPCRHYTSVS